MKKLTTIEFIERAIKIHGDKFDYSLVEYTNSYTKIKIKCNKCNNFFNQLPNGHLFGSGCSWCSHHYINTKKFIEKAVKIHGENYDYSLVEYINAQTKIKINCKKCNELFNQTPNGHLSGKGCPNNKCNGRGGPLSVVEFIEKSLKIHGENYDYSLVEYINSQTKVKIKCKTCYEYFFQTTSSHLQGYGCAKCNKYAKLTQQQFVEKAVKAHGNKYDYSLVVYENSKNKVKIKCTTCCEYFFQTPESHLGGRGCPFPKCNLHTRCTKEIFIEKAVKIHGENYDYSSVDYVTNNIKVKIKCNRCGKYFNQTPGNHLSKHGCPNCCSSFSKPEIEWLNLLDVKEEYRQKTLRMTSGKRYLVDGYNPNTNTVYEFLGDFWHGNPKIYNPSCINKIIKISFGLLFEKTQLKLKELTENGYNIVVIWENDFKEQIKKNKK